MATHGIIQRIQDTNQQEYAIIPSALFYCSDQADIEAKTAQPMAQNNDQFVLDSLKEGTTIRVLFTQSNQAEDPTLNVCNTGDVPIYIDALNPVGVVVSDSWMPLGIVTFTYSAAMGGVWIMNDVTPSEGGGGGLQNFVDEEDGGVAGLNSEAIGANSFAHGYQTSAQGDYSYASGYNAVASTIGAHAEGYGVSASGNYSHAEGYGSTAGIGPAAHAEGYFTAATGSYAHSEGMYSRAYGYYSHAEGYGSTASGNGSHAQGRETIANGEYQHVEGKYNVASTQYAHIVGNGASTSSRSNAYTLDWSGNGVFAGKVTLGSNAVNSMDAVTLAQLQNSAATYTQGAGIDISVNNQISVESNLSVIGDTAYLQYTTPSLAGCFIKKAHPFSGLSSSSESISLPISTYSGFTPIQILNYNLVTQNGNMIIQNMYIGTDVNTGAPVANFYWFGTRNNYGNVNIQSFTFDVLYINSDLLLQVT